MSLSSKESPGNASASIEPEVAHGESDENTMVAIDWNTPISTLLHTFSSALSGDSTEYSDQYFTESHAQNEQLHSMMQLFDIRETPLVALASPLQADAGSGTGLVSAVPNVLPTTAGYSSTSAPVMSHFQTWLRNTCSTSRLEDTELLFEPSPTLVLASIPAFQAVPPLQLPSPPPQFDTRKVTATARVTSPFLPFPMIGSKSSSSSSSSSDNTDRVSPEPARRVAVGDDSDIIAGLNGHSTITVDPRKARLEKRRVRLNAVPSAAAAAVPGDIARNMSSPTVSTSAPCNKASSSVTNSSKACDDVYTTATPISASQSQQRSSLKRPQDNASLSSSSSSPFPNSSPSPSFMAQNDGDVKRSVKRVRIFGDPILDHQLIGYSKAETGTDADRIAENTDSSTSSPSSVVLAKGNNKPSSINDTNIGRQHWRLVSHTAGTGTDHHRGGAEIAVQSAPPFQFKLRPFLSPSSASVVRPEAAAVTGGSAAAAASASASSSSSLLLRMLPQKNVMCAHCHGQYAIVAPAANTNTSDAASPSGVIRRTDLAYRTTSMPCCDNPRCGVRCKAVNDTNKRSSSSCSNGGNNGLRCAEDDDDDDESPRNGEAISAAMAPPPSALPAMIVLRQECPLCKDYQTPYTIGSFSRDADKWAPATVTATATTNRAPAEAETLSPLLLSSNASRPSPTTALCWSILQEHAVLCHGNCPCCSAPDRGGNRELCAAVRDAMYIDRVSAKSPNTTRGAQMGLPLHHSARYPAARGQLSPAALASAALAPTGLQRELPSAFQQIQRLNILLSLRGVDK